MYEKSTQCFIYGAVLKKDLPAYTGYRQPCSYIIALKTDILMCVTVQNVCNNFGSLD